MARRFLWLPVALLAVTALAQPWRADEAEARRAPKPPAACSADDLTKLRAELAASQSELAAARAEVARMLQVERARAKKLERQLGSPMIETLKGTENLR